MEILSKIVPRQKETICVKVELIQTIVTNNLFLSKRKYLKLKQLNLTNFDQILLVEKVTKKKAQKIMIIKGQNTTLEAIFLLSFHKNLKM